MGSSSDELSDAPARASAVPRELDDRTALELLSALAAQIAGERDPDVLVQRVTDEATVLLGAQFGAFFYNVVNDAGESFSLYALSGVPREAFSRFQMPRNTAVFAPTFRGDGIVRSADITRDPRYGKSAPHYGMPHGHLPVRSYLAAPVKSSADEVLGGLFFGHEVPGIFDATCERALAALAPIVATALTNARLFTQLAGQETELRKSETRYRLVSEAMQEGIWYWDVPSNTVEWNDRLLELMGVSRAEWGGTFDDWFARVHPDDQPLMSAALKAHLEQRVPYHIELFRLRRADGTYRCCTTAGQAEWDAEGRPLRMAGSFRDITDRKLAEERLAVSEQRLAQILDSVQDMVFTKNDQLEITWANTAACRYYGLSLDELRSANDVSFNDVELTRQYNRDDRHVFATGRSVEQVEEQNVAPNGEIRVFHTVKTPIFGSEGQVVELVGVSRDVTQRKRALDAQRLLAEASATLSASIDYEVTLANVARSTVPLFADWSTVDLLDDTGDLRRLAVHHVDPSKVAMAHALHVKYPPDMHAPYGLPHALRTAQVDFMSDIPDAVLVEGAKDAEHLATLRALGLRSYIVAPIIVGGSPIGAISFVSAESKRSYDEADVAFVTELSRRAAVAIENARLYRRVTEAREAAESANRLKDEFLAIVSHELRTPLNAISGWASILATGLNDEDKKRRAVDAILRNAQMQTRIIDDILDVSRIVSGKLELVRAPVSLAAVVRAAVDSVRPSAAAKDLRLSLDLGDESAMVHVDAERMQQVVWNLLVNAVKFTAAGGSVWVSVRAHEGQAVLAVADDGIGIDAPLLPHVFEAFRQGDSSKTRSHGGLGLGLSIVRHLVEMQGGAVRAASEGKGRGATFTVQMPMAIEDATAKSLTVGARKHVTGTLGALSPAALRGVRVLVVDDEPEAREILNEVLSTLGAEVVTAGSVQEALDAVTSFRPDVLVSDIGMPEVDGYSLARKLRALPAEAGGQIPAVALTAYARAIDRIEAERAGYQRHLAKPVSPNALVATLVELLGRASVPPAAE